MTVNSMETTRAGLVGTQAQAWRRMSGSAAREGGHPAAPPPPPRAGFSLGAYVLRQGCMHVTPQGRLVCVRVAQGA
jgi:hypothetical protein